MDQELHTPWWAIHRQTYRWTLSLAHKKRASLLLLYLSAAESSFFPIAPDILQIAMTLEKPVQAWRYASVATIGSVIGGVIGYAIGALVWPLVSPFFFHYIFSQETFNDVGLLYHRWDFLAVFVAAFTPIPYKAFTLAAGAFHLPLSLFILASIIGRSARFFLIAWLLSAFGTSIKSWIEQYFNLITLALIVILGIGIFLLR